MCITFCTDDDDFLHRSCWNCGGGSEKLNVLYIRRGPLMFDINCALCT